MRVLAVGKLTDGVSDQIQAHNQVRDKVRSNDVISEVLTAGEREREKAARGLESGLGKSMAENPDDEVQVCVCKRLWWSSFLAGGLV
jgi:hypothetical protein